ncbi:MAG: low affinity iron permease family protein [Fimbriimonadales bacterium]
MSLFYSKRRLEGMDHKRSFFTRLAQAAAHATGRPIAFLIAVLVVAGWAVSGPFMGFSDTWQLFINTGTTVATFLMVFLMQSTQNRDTKALQIKLDELIRACEGADNQLLDLEEIDEDELAEIQARYEHLAEDSRKRGGDGSVRPLGD